ncbi:hypothetical protein K9N50_11335 [bacterium]|nr:hypothetical protein [bacterium]
MIIYTDLETIPSGDPIDPAEMPHPARMSLEKTIEAWRRDKAPQEAEEQYRKRALDSMQGEIVCICWAIDDERIHSLISSACDEELLLFDFIQELRRDIPQHEPITWVGHFGLTFDMLWLWRKAVKYNLGWLIRNIRLERYRSNAEDTNIMWNGVDRGYTSLASIAAFLDVGEPIGSGAEIYDHYLAGEYEKIIEHCKQDVEICRAIYKKMKGE